MMSGEKKLSSIHRLACCEKVMTWSVHQNYSLGTYFTFTRIGSSGRSRLHSFMQ